MFFFSFWQLAGKFFVILGDEIVGQEVKKFYNDVCFMLWQIIDEKWFMVKVVIGLFFVNMVVDDDIVIYINEERIECFIILYYLCQQV